MVVGERPEQNGDEQVPVSYVDVGVEPPVEAGLGDEVHERVGQLRQEHQDVRRVLAPHPSSRLGDLQSHSCR
jgi:hypothetical protein